MTTSSRLRGAAPAWSAATTRVCSTTNPEWQRRAETLAERTWELVSFLVDVRGVKSVGARCDGVATYHDSCSGLRELGIEGQPRRLLRTVEGLSLAEMADTP